MTIRALGIRLSPWITALTLLPACGSQEAERDDDSLVPLSPSESTASPTTPEAPSPTVVPTDVAPSTSGVAPSASPGVTSGATGGGDGAGGTAPTPSSTSDGPSGTGGAIDAGGASGAGGAPAPGPTVGAGGADTGSAGTSATGGTEGLAGASGAGGSGGMGAGGSGSEEPAASRLPPVENYADVGPFRTTSQTSTGPDGTYTIVHPATLGEDGFLHAPITFGPGTGMQVSQLMGLLERFASHGFVVIGRQLEGGPRDPVTRMRMIAGLDWIIAQNSTAGSVFEGKLDVQRAVAMGYSVGGTGAVEIGGHEAIATVVSIHGHGAEGDLRGPLLLVGGTDDVQRDGVPWLAPTYEASRVQTFFGTVIGADHGYIQGTVGGVPGGVETPAIIAWIRYWIYDDQDARRYFYGDDCVMCAAPWTNPQRKNWP